ncbi:MAG: von Willebrand factor type A domain-containing protein, partial [Planctomycetes bacterium]|nr:von Willebrand factor type A domain-containing protein [Planctomycetota bacterium]
EDPRLREKRAELERMLGLLAECREEPTLGDAEREKLRTAAQTPPQVSSWSPFSRNARWAAAAVVVAGVLAVLDPQGGAPLMESETAVSGAFPDFKVPAGGDTTGLSSLGYIAANSSNESTVVKEKIYRGPGDSAPAAPLQEGASAALATSPATPPPSTGAPTGGGLAVATPNAPANTVIGVGGGIGGKSGGKFGGRAGNVPRASAGADSRNRQSFGQPAADARRISGQDREGLRVQLGAELQLDESLGRNVLGNLDGLGYADGDFGGRDGRPVAVIHDGYGYPHRGPAIVHHIRRRPHENPRDMFYRYYGDNPYVVSEKDALSTFAADVDTASWALVRNYLVQGNIPEKNMVRTEEMLNWLDDGLAAPTEGDFAVHLEMAESRYAEGEEGVSMLKIGIKGREVAAADRKPLNLVFVVDRSGSMRKGTRMEMVKRSLELLVDQMRDGDTVGIVSFNNEARLEMEPTGADDRWKIREAIRAIEIGGSTNAEAGLLMGYEMAERGWHQDKVNRVILCSDGVANTGETDQIRILEKVRSFAEQEIDLTTVGVGMGNHNDVFLEQLANKGDGSCHYVDDYQEAKRVFVERFTGTLQTIARDVKIQVEMNPGIIEKWRQLGYENRAVADADFRNDAVDAGEIGAGHEVVALYELQSHMGVAAGDWIAKVRLRWFADGAKEATETEHVLKLGEGAARWELASTSYRRSAIAAQFAEFLRRSYWVRGDSYDRLLADAQALAKEVGDSQTAELRDMIRKTASLVHHLTPAHDELHMLIEEARRLALLGAEVEEQAERSEELQAKLDEIRVRNDELEEQIRKLLQ